MAAPSINLSGLSIVSQVGGTNPTDNEHDDAEWTTFSTPTNYSDSRRWGVASADLAFPYDGHDGYIYMFYGDSFGSQWEGPNVSIVAGASRTIAAGSNNVLISDIGGSVTTLVVNSGTGFPTTGLPCVSIAVTADSSRLTWISYTSRSGTTLSGVKLIYSPDSTKRLTTGDTIICNGSRGDDHRSNTLFRTATTNLTNGPVIDTFKKLNPSGIALQAIPGRTEAQEAVNVFPSSKSITSISRTSNLVTVSSTNHRLVEGQPVTISGVPDTSFNGTFNIVTVTSANAFTYAQTAADASSSGGTCFGAATITSATGALGFVVTIVTNVPHDLVEGQEILIAGTGMGAADGEKNVLKVVSSTSFTYITGYTGGPGATGTVQNGVFSNTADSDGGGSTNPAAGFEGTVIPQGAIAIEKQTAGQITIGTSWSGGTVTLNMGTTHYAYVGEAINVSGLTPSSLNGDFIVTGVSATEISYALASDPGTITDGSGLVKWTRHYAYYESISYFTASNWVSNYMGIAYSDDKGDNWTREGITGGTYGTADTSKIWSNNKRFTDNFQGVWPVDGEDGYIYCFSTRAGRQGPMRLMRVAKADILTKSSYTYWDGSTWNASISSASDIFGTWIGANGPNYLVGEPAAYRHPATGLWISTTIDASFGVGDIMLRTAPNPYGPWSDAVVLIDNADFGNADHYGGWIYPQRSTDDPQVFRFMISLWAPYSTYMFVATITDVKPKVKITLQAVNRAAVI
jgi:hypothetical protein